MGILGDIREHQVQNADVNLSSTSGQVGTLSCKPTLDLVNIMFKVNQKHSKIVKKIPQLYYINFICKCRIRLLGIS